MKRIKLTNCKEYVLVDDYKFNYLNSFKWHKNSRGYAVGYLGDYTVKRMHRLIMGEPKGFEVDHINGNKLDNRKANLRVCTHNENCKNASLSARNKSGYKGVHRHKGDSTRKARWTASIQVNRRQIWLGSFPNREEAALAYDRAALKYHGEFARLNYA